MANQDGSENAPRPSRVVPAQRFRNGVLEGDIEIIAYTKHGQTSMLSVDPSEKLSPGEVLKTGAWILGARQFVIIGEHKKPMKIPGRWYEVRVVKQTT